MQVAKPITLYLPGLLVKKLEQRIQDRPPTWSYKMDYFYYLIQYLTLRMIQRKKQESGFFPIDLKNSKLAPVSNIDRYVKYLVDGELLLRDNYIIGKKSYHYKLRPEFLQGVHTVQLKPGTRVYERLIIKARNKRKHVDRLGSHMKSMRKLFMEVDLNYSGAMEWIESQPVPAKKFVYSMAIGMLQDKRLRYFSQNKTNGRLDTNLTGLKKEFRKFIVGDWVSIDLANSQPFFLSHLLEALFTHVWGDRTQLATNPDISNPNNHTIPLCSNFFNVDLDRWFGRQVVNGISKIPQNEQFPSAGELLNFQESCRNGTLYDDFLCRFEGAGLIRDDVKNMIFAVLFSQNVAYPDNVRMIPYEKEKEQFAKVYPTISRVIEILKQKDHSKLAIVLQQLESTIFIDTICPRLVDEGIVPLTIHDSIIVEAGQKEEAMEVCRDVFLEGFGVIPTFHVEPLKKNEGDNAGSVSGGEKSLSVAVENEAPGKVYRLSA